MHQVQTSLVDDHFEQLHFDDVSVKHDARDEVFATLKIKLRNGTRERPASLKVKVDTGAQGNILPLRTFRRMYPELLDANGFPATKSLRKCTTILTAYNGESIRHYGTLKIQCAHRQHGCDIEFYVADTPGPAITCLPSCRAMNLVVMNCEVNTSTSQNDVIYCKEDLCRTYPDRFQGIGTFEGTFHITTDPTVTPVVHAPRRCSIHLHDEIRKELDIMVDLGVIAKVIEPTDWVPSLVYSRKWKSNGRLRVCLDPKELNKAIKRPHYRTPTLDEITHKLAGASMFSKLDARHGYWSVKLDDESSILTTFNSPFGRYCFKRLPFGLNLSQDVFQERMDNILEMCPGTIGIADDIGVFGRDAAEHDANLYHLTKTAQRHGLVFNDAKCEIKRTTIRFFGLIFDADGVHPDPERIEDIRRMKKQENATELKEFLIIATYMSPFIPNLSVQTATLRDLLKKDAEFNWNTSHDNAFEATKALVCREVTLAYFIPGADTVVQVDASGRGLAAVLLQGGKPIAFASKSLSECKKRYANIEREMLAVVFGCERFHTCVRHHSRHGPVHDKQRVVRNCVGLLIQVPVRLPDSQPRDERRCHLKDEIALRRTRSAATCSQL